MSLEGSDPPSQTLDHLLGWLEDSASFTPFSGFDDTCFLHEINGSQSWEWDQTQDFGHDLIYNLSQDPLINRNEFMSDGTTDDLVTGAPTIVPDPPSELLQPSDQSRKRNGDALVEVRTGKRSARNRRNTNKSAAKSCNDGNKDERWAEQLLNPCAMAITAGNSSRVQHYLCVLRELASSSGDPNYRLAAFGLRALTHHLSSYSSVSAWPALTFASAEVRMFQQTLLRFYEVSPWFAFPNNMANSAILQILAQESSDRRELHILDIGVSHGMQWPTLLEALSRRSEGPPHRVQITIISDQNMEIPFSVGPPAYNYSSQLLSFARSLNINLQISILNNFPLQNLSFQHIETSPHETLVICAQFRLHQLKHNNPDERTEVLKALRTLGAKGLILSDNNAECSCRSCGDFATGFSRKLEYLWKFLDSTNSGFKGQASEERKLMEGEATKALGGKGEMNEGKERWFDRMRRAGFATEIFGEDAIDGARALLRKYDNNWEIRMEDGDTFAGLWWKGEAVSFCSLWK